MEIYIILTIGFIAWILSLTNKDKNNKLDI